MSIYSFQTTLSNGEEMPLETLKGDVLLIVNTASKCGLTPQYEELEELYKNHKEKGLQIVGFPCDQFGGQEPGTDEEISEFCSVNYGVSFPLSQKIEVNGENAHPIYEHLRSKAPADAEFDEAGALQKEDRDMLESSDIQWNFTKFLVDRKGNVVHRFAPTVKPKAMEQIIERLLEESR
ncbi:glutathione peroxidase [Microbacterium sp. APC 3898]|uniref:Glutathione peroxidase n=1 Tax=Planococcus notacanthi TaxID=3035188 RepID=A0ABT7ZK36_9BACL|nr:MULTISPECIES: glutathione peroxidase [Terrabacteria group]MDN3427427.1 glutathione peroxidase [Planococcus sp. APC 4016]MDN3436778.1 glutathione peroxidase [Planococcus sp. APC 3900]MDN3499711.1 glutathione peroxidase [Microbacterium sp. APC 3898]